MFFQRRVPSVKHKWLFRAFCGLTLIGWIVVIDAWVKMYQWREFVCVVQQHTVTQNDQLVYEAKFGYCTENRETRLCNSKRYGTYETEADAAAALESEYPIGLMLACYRNNHYDTELKTSTTYEDKSWGVHFPLLFVVPIVSANLVMLGDYAHKQGTRWWQGRQGRGGAQLTEPLHVHYDDDFGEL